MIAARFRSVYWVALASFAGLGCYMVTQRVAAERTALNRLERQILGRRLAIRSLETELGTRGSMAQLERWNREVLDLRAAGAAQFVTEGVQLASLNASPIPGTTAAPRATPIPAAASAGGVQRASTPADAAGVAMVRPANYVRPVESRIDPKRDPIVHIAATAAVHPERTTAEIRDADRENDGQ